MSTMAEEIPSRFDFAAAAPRIYEMWQQNGLFHAEPDLDRKPYTIVIPPPNVTGALHLGHALNNTLQDIVIRMKRMQGFNTLWMPGTDHAGIATQAVVERRLKSEENKTRHDLGREQLVAKIWQWKEQYEARILGQLQRMGCSCDWQRTRFTLDERCARAVRETFFDLFNKDLIYRGKRLVNWDTHLQTAVSDDEVFNKTVKGQFWHLMYPVIDPQPGEPAHVHVATTRPETMLGDTAVAVHPDPAHALDKYESELREKLAKANESETEAIQAQLDAVSQRRTIMLPQLERLRDMAADGRKVKLPLMDREIPIVADVWAKPELGSGCVKITPAHDPNDHDVAKRCDLEMINILNVDGTLNAEAGDYAGLTIKQARKKVVDDLEALGLMEKVEDRNIELPHSDRSKSPIEPLLADQWFVRMQDLAQSAMDAVADGRVKITPDRYAKGYLDWLGEKRDWPVSRQLWWGHRIPVWSKGCMNQEECDQLTKAIQSIEGFDSEHGAIQIEPCHETNDEKRQKLGLPLATVHVCIKEEGHSLEDSLTALGLIRVEDVLDTWFSSALWPHSTLGWPEKTPELEYFYPTNTLITSRDIITLWVARMVLMSLNNLGTIPFSDVFIHPKILDGQGETMSKSKGNGIDPIDVIEKFGADSLRFAMCDLTTETQDVRMPVQFECPHCQASIEQTKKNRVLPVIECKHCKKLFSTQWAESEEDKTYPRGAVISERFDDGMKFGNKLWNAARFAMSNLEGYSAAPISEADLTTEDRWMLSRLATVSHAASGHLEHFRYANAAKLLKGFAWDEFCSFFIEIMKDRFADESQRAHSQRMLAFSLDQLLRLLHPIMPFITEEIWQIFNEFAPERGLESVEPANAHLITASWPRIDAKWRNEPIEHEFALFQSALGALREIRSRQNVPPKKRIDFSIRCNNEHAAILQPMSAYFGSMALADSTGFGPDVEPPATVATVSLGELDVHVDLEGLIDKAAEKKRLEKEKARVEGQIKGSEAKLANANFVDRAPVEVVQQVRDSLAAAKEQLESINKAIEKL